MSSIVLSRCIKCRRQYSKAFLFTIPTDHQELFDYRKRLRQEISNKFIVGQPLCLLIGGALYWLTRALKSKALALRGYFFIPYLLASYGIVHGALIKVSEKEYPPHPIVIEKRKELIEALAYMQPK